MILIGTRMARRLGRTVGDRLTLVAPRGPAVTVLQRAELAELPLEDVLAALPPDLSNGAAGAKSKPIDRSGENKVPHDG